MVYYADNNLKGTFQLHRFFCNSFERRNPRLDLPQEQHALRAETER